MKRLVRFLDRRGYAVQWCLMAIPAGFVCGGLCALWHWMSGQNVVSGLLGGILGIAWSFPVIGIVHQLAIGKSNK